jgi:hypothetical protein
MVEQSCVNNAGATTSVLPASCSGARHTAGLATAAVACCLSLLFSGCADGVEFENIKARGKPIVLLFGGRCVNVQADTASTVALQYVALRQVRKRDKWAASRQMLTGIGARRVLLYV